jgi:predicted nucleic acid-binding protein
VFDSGALIAAEKNDRKFWALWKNAVVRDFDLVIPSTVLAQCWRGRAGSRMSLVANACTVEPLSVKTARAVGELCGKASTNDIVDAHVVVIADERHATIVTSDPDDISHLSDLVNCNLRILDISDLC